MILSGLGKGKKNTSPSIENDKDADTVHAEGTKRQTVELTNAHKFFFRVKLMAQVSLKIVPTRLWDKFVLTTKLSSMSGRRAQSV